MTDIVERLRARLQRDCLGRFDPELSIVIGPDIYQDIMEAAGTVEGLRDERNAMRAEIERLRAAAQGVPEGWKLVPIEPTAGMIETGCDNNPTMFNEGTDVGFAADVANDVYVAMVRAAPAMTSAEHPQETAADNAALIAAIPEMIAALEDIDQTTFSMVNDSESLRHAIKSMQSRARAVLKKVKK